MAAGSQILIQVGIDSSTSSRINLNQQVDLSSISATSLGLDILAVSTAAAALTALDSINAAIDTVTASRGKVGAVQNRLVRTISSLSITVENLQAAESAIRTQTLLKK